jgi:hypothetical protein
MGDESSPKPLEAPMAVWVQGGTTSMAHDQEQARKRAEAEARRDAEAERHRIAYQNPLESRVNTTGLYDPNQHATVVLGFRHKKDNTIFDWMICELVQAMNPSSQQMEMMLQMVCVHCMKRKNMAAGDAQFRLWQTHREWSIDQRTIEQRAAHPLKLPIAGEIWVNPENHAQVLQSAGTITTHGWVTCAGTACWSFRIDDSVIHTRSP